MLLIDPPGAGSLDSDVVVSVHGLLSSLVLVDPGRVAAGDGLLSHLVDWSGFVGPVGAVVNSGNKSLRTLDNSVLGNPFEGVVWLPSSLSGEVWHAGSVRLLNPAVSSG